MPTTLTSQLEILAREPSANPHPTPLLFVHGAWHGAWCWDERFLPYFAARGYRSYAVSLRGHGGSEAPPHVRTMRIRDYVADVAQAAKQLDRPPVVIGHSMGGLVVQKYLERHTAPAAILLASVPTRGVLRTTLNIARKHPLRFAQANLTWTLYPLVNTPRIAREMLFSRDLPEDEVRAHWMRLQNEAYLAYLDMIVFALPRPRRVNTPLLALGAERDAIFTPREVRRAARAYGGDATIFPDMAHDMMLEPGWQSVADTMIEWLQAHNV